MTSLAAKTNRDDLEYLIKLVEEGSIKPVIDRSYTLEKTGEAFEYLRQSHAQGKVVIKVGKHD